MIVLQDFEKDCVCARSYLRGNDWGALSCPVTAAVKGLFSGCYDLEPVVGRVRRPFVGKEERQCSSHPGRIWTLQG